MYIEPGNDLSSFIKILTDDETKLSDILDVQDSGNGCSSEDSSNEGVEKKLIHLHGNNKTNREQNVSECGSVYSKILKLEACIACLEETVKEQANTINLLSVDMMHFSRKETESGNEDSLLEFQGNGILHFILTHLKIPTNRNIIRWTNKAKKKFQIVDPQKFALMWGREKNKQNMTMGKLRRSLNYQVHIGKLKRISKNHYYVNVSQKEETSTKIQNDCASEIHCVNKKEKHRNSCQRENATHREIIEEKMVTSYRQSIDNQVTDNDFHQSINYIKNILSELPTTITIPSEVDSKNNEKVEAAFAKPIFDNKKSNLVLNANENISCQINIGHSNNIQSLVSRSRDILENQEYADDYVLMDPKTISYSESSHNNAFEYISKFNHNIPNADSSNTAASKITSVIQNYTDETVSLPLVIPFCDFDLYLRDFEDMN